jgi:uncharacterized secreted protein with C-terminal beta-propeller domain
MKRLTPLLFLTLLFVTSCSTFRSGLKVPANQTFLLGEFNDKNYSAELINKSDLTVTVKAIDKNTGEVTQSFGLAPKEKTKIYINKDETVYFNNENVIDVKIDVILSQFVEGMRYIDND